MESHAYNGLTTSIKSAIDAISKATSTKTRQLRRKCNKCGACLRLKKRVMTSPLKSNSISSLTSLHSLRMDLFARDLTLRAKDAPRLFTARAWLPRLSGSQSKMPMGTLVSTALAPKKSLCVSLKPRLSLQSQKGLHLQPLSSS